MSKENAIIAVRLFPALVQKHLQDYASDDVVPESTLKKILEEAIDSTIELDIDDPTALMAVSFSTRAGRIKRS